ncbi:orotate phosphoribosyltransferase [Ferrovum sp.]|uniref:orotate phosphoribosyltransferase n=1 Tax=Ferrovum sp. TaxID=2609467 RepID=UPI002639D2F5|nr:orotate phosphoribosyltransferase [Ferrovum sp.]
MGVSDFSERFIAFAVERQVIRFGAFKTKAGRLSPYFFNAGLFNTGAALATLCEFYADAIEAQAPPFDLLFGPAYKGIPLVAGIAMTLARRGRDVPFAYNRKEAKDHGEGGVLVGADPQGKRVLIVDDVISAGTSVRESVVLLSQAQAVPAGVVIALDRMERGQTERSATQEVTHQWGLPVCCVATLEHLVAHLDRDPTQAETLRHLHAYRQQYGVGGPTD